MGFGTFQCPRCGCLWSPAKSALTAQLNAARATKSRLETERERLQQSDSAAKGTPSFRAKNLRLKADIMEAEWCIKTIYQEMKGLPAQVWQNRYEKTLKVLEEMLDSKSYKAVMEAINKACEIKE